MAQFRYRPIDIAHLVFVCAAYVAAAKLGLEFATIHGNVTPIWPPSGIALAALLLGGYRLWPGVLLGAFLTNLFTDIPVASTVGIALGNTAEGLAGVAMLRWMIGDKINLGRVREVLAFIGAGLSVSMIAATVGVLSLATWGAAPWSAFVGIWWVWWLGDATGIFVVAPFLVSVLQRHTKILHLVSIEGVVVMVLAFVLSQFVFGGGFGAMSSDYPLAFTPVAMLVWAALRLGRCGATTATLIISGVATVGTARGYGPFALPSAHESFLVLQAFMAVCTMTALALAATMSQRRKAENSLRKLSRALEQNPNAVFITDTEGTIEYVNRTFSKLTGYSAAEAIGETPRLLKSNNTPKEVFKDLWHTIKNGKNWRGELQDRHKDGHVFWVHETIAPVKDEHGEVTHFVATHEDITERKDAEQAAHIALEKADIANRAKSELMANMSHELRTPLNAIIGFSSAIEAETFGGIGHDKYREYVEHISSSGQHLLALINDILDASAIEAGKLEILEEDLEVLHVGESAIRLVKHLAKDGEVKLSCNVQHGVAKLYADERRVKQILINLLSNAIKFTPPGGAVELDVQCTGKAGHVFTVSDNGIGMDKTELEKALQPFGQVDGGLNRKQEGTGLGLPLTKGLAELHGAHFNIQSRKGRGTTVTVTFPAQRVASDG